MNTLEIIISVFSTLVGLIGGGVGIFYWREAKAIKAAEAKDKFTDVEMKQAEEWNKLYKEQKGKSDEKSQRLKLLYAERDKLKEELNESKFCVERLCWFYCTVSNCPHRVPPHRFDEKGHEIEAEMFAKNDEQHQS